MSETTFASIQREFMVGHRRFRFRINVLSVEKRNSGIIPYCCYFLSRFAVICQEKELQMTANHLDTVKEETLFYGTRSSPSSTFCHHRS